MLKIFQVTISIVFIACGVGCSGEEPIGECGTYQAFPGTCTGTADNTFTFEGTKDGETVVLTGNILYSAETLAEGESTSCAFSWTTGGACTPCLFDIGECAEEAWDYYNSITTPQ